MGTDLAPITSEADRLAIEAVTTNSWHWVGVRRRSSGSSIWDRTGSNYVTNSYHRWGDDEPNNSGGEECVHIKGSDKWND